MKIEFRMDLKVKAFLLAFLCIIGAFTGTKSTDCRLMDHIIRDMADLTDRCNAQLERADNAGQMAAALERYVEGLRQLKPRVQMARDHCPYYSQKHFDCPPIDCGLNHALMEFRQALARSRIIFSLKLGKYVAQPQIINALRELRNVKLLDVNQLNIDEPVNYDSLKIGDWEIHDKTITSTETQSRFLMRSMKFREIVFP